MIKGNLVRESIDRQNNTKQAGETYRQFEQWEKTELISNLVNDLSACDPRIQEKMIALAEEADEDYGRHLREGLAQAKSNGSLKNRWEIKTEIKHQNKQLIKVMKPIHINWKTLLSKSGV